MRAQLIVMLPLFLFIRYGISTRIALGLFLAFFVLRYVAQYSYLTTGNAVSSSDVQEVILAGASETDWIVDRQTSAVNRLVGGYSQKPLVQRIALLPVAMMVQYATPFDFWVFKDDYPWYILLRNFNGIWFLFSGPLTIFSLWYVFEAKNAMLQRFSIVAICFYAIIAFSYSGVIPRYFTPFMPLFIITAAWTWDKITKEKAARKLWETFYASYCSIGILFLLIYSISKILVS